MDEDKNKYIIEAIHRNLKKPITIIGLMGAGKTKLGRMLGHALDLPFYDSDHEIEAAAGMSIPDIFEKFGEPYFRDGEQRVIQRILSERVCVLATGGGAIMNDVTAKTIWNDTISIWIKADLDVMVQRTSETDNRPLLKTGNPRDILKNLMTLRYPTYEKADIMVKSHPDVAGLTCQEALEKLHHYLENH